MPRASLEKFLTKATADINRNADFWLAVTCHNDSGQMVSYAIPFNTEIEASNYLDAEAKRVTGITDPSRINLAGYYDFTGEPGTFFGEVLPLNVTSAIE